jgi:hypothetical protein
VGGQFYHLLVQAGAGSSATLFPFTHYGVSDYFEKSSLFNRNSGPHNNANNSHLDYDPAFIGAD